MNYLRFLINARNVGSLSVVIGVVIAIIFPERSTILTGIIALLVFGGLLLALYGLLTK
jgi:hypothetical protein